MDKFSIYEFMSFFLPGVLASYIGLLLLPESFLFLKPQDELIDGLLYTIISLLVGLCIHRITFLLIDYTWYKKLIKKPINEIIESKKDFLNDHYQELDKKYNKDKLEPSKLFTKAYYYLEFQDKIAPTKTFQSMYFFLRNIVTLGFIVFPVLIFATIFKLKVHISLPLLLIDILVLPILIFTARFYRQKMVDRVFNTFYVAQECKEK